MQSVYLMVFAVLFLAALATDSAGVEWKHERGVEKRPEGGYLVTDPDAALTFKPFEPTVTSERSYLLLKMTVSKPVSMRVFWLRTATLPVSGKTFELKQIEPAGQPVVRVIDLAMLGKYHNDDNLELQIHGNTGLEFDVQEVKLLTFEEVPKDQLPSLVDFRCFTSKLHYLPGEQIEFKATMFTRSYPDRAGSKILSVKLKDSEGKVVTEHIQHYGIQPLHQIKELFGVFNLPAKLKPGKYSLEAETTDQYSRFTLTTKHEFGVQDKSDPFVYETPFKFVKDFSVIRGHDGLWHVFSITGDFLGTHEWLEDGQERTFSHGTSPDLRNWTYHKPVISISDTPYFDGNGFHKNRNVWAPHVIRRGDTYYMFYTSVNQHTSQSISLATSKDLFNWEDHPMNPVVTMEGVEWAAWSRQGGACRDPMVLEDGGKFYMYVTADAKEGDERGVVAVLESDDLIKWDNAQIAARGPIALESPHVWKSGDTYYMLTSSYGAAVWSSKHPVTGWRKDDFPRTPVRKREKYVHGSPGYAEEVVRLEDGSIMIASLTFRRWGNSIYFFRMNNDASGRPAGYTSPFKWK